MGAIVSLIEKINAHIRSGLVSWLREWLPDGKVEGHEFIAKNPRRADGKHGSFKVNIHSCVWRDFALNEKGGNDPVSLYAYVRSLPMGEAARELAQKIGGGIDSKPAPQKQAPPPSENWSIVLPTPPDAPELPNLSPQHWVYRDAAGEFMGVIERINKPGGGKDFLPWTVWKNGEGVLQWKRKNFPDPRPIYGLDLLAKNPKGAVLIVEGEKACEAARKLVPWAVCVSWPGGANACQKVDWSPLKGRAVAIWPDADEPGMMAAAGGYKEVRDPSTGEVKQEYVKGIADFLHGNTQYVKVVRPPEGVEKGWDLADAERDKWTPDRVREHIKDQAFIWEPSGQEASEEKTEPVNEAPHQDTPPMVPAQPEPEMSAEEENLINGGWASEENVGNLKRRITMNFSEKNDRGAPIATIENLNNVLTHLGLTVRYNVISKEEEILIPMQSFSIDNKANASFAWVLSWCNRVRFPTANLGDYLTYLSDSNLYNPVANWVQSKKWDDKSRLEDFYATVKSVDETPGSTVESLKKTLMRRWLLSAVAAAFEPNGVSAHGVLVFQGPQYLGKTAWFKRLAPPDLNVIADGMMLKPDDRDSVKQAVSFWLVELGELDATFRKADIAQLKSFLTRDRDVLRRAYARKESEFARRTVFFASVNPKQFLHDSTGNRRYWTIECAEINHQHDIDMQQIWAEVYELYKKGEKWFLSHDEMVLLNEHNETFEAKDAIEERIITDLNWTAADGLWREMTATDVLRDLGLDRPSQGEKSKASQAIFKMNGNKKRKSNGLTLLWVPPRSYTPGVVDQQMFPPRKL